MAISDAQATKLNNSMRAAQDVSLGDIIQEAQLWTSGSIMLTAVHTNASVVTVVPGLGSTLQGFQVQAFRGGSPVYNPYVGNNSGSLSFMANTAGSYVMTVNDVLNWVAWSR